MLEAKAKDQGHKAQVLSKKKKKRSSQKFFKRSPLKNVFQKIFQALHKISTFQKIVQSSSRGQANFRGLEASRPRPRPRTSKCVLEDVLEAKDVLEDSTSGNYCHYNITSLLTELPIQKTASQAAFSPPTYYARWSLHPRVVNGPTSTSANPKTYARTRKVI